MCNVDVLWPEFFVQALAQASYSEFRDGKYASDRVAPESSGGAGEDKRSSLARAFIRVIDRIGQFVAFESRHHGSRERKGPNYPGGGRAFDVIVRHLKELLKSSFPSVIDGDANLR